MGMFDKFLTKEKTQENSISSNEEAYWNVLFCITASDGNLADEEMRTLLVIGSHKSLLKGTEASPHLESFFQKCKAAGGFQAILVASIEKLDPEYYQTLFVDVVDLIFSDGLVEDSEKDMLNSIGELMNISEEFAGKVIEVTSIKYT